VEDGGDNTRKFIFSGPSVRTKRHRNVTLNCPVIGYPKPDIVWYKDGKPIKQIVSMRQWIRLTGDEDRDRVKYVSNDSRLIVRDAAYEDEGLYKCVARNLFPTKVDGEKETFELVLTQQLRVTNPLSWLIPLAIIVVVLILLVATIYLCSVCSKSREYNVARKEKELGKTDAEAQHLNKNGATTTDYGA